MACPWVALPFLIVAFAQPSLSDDILADTLTPTEEYVHKVQLDESGRYFLFWKFDDESVTLEAHVQTAGWVGLGFSPNGGMKGSDMVIGWVADGQPDIYDGFADGNVRPRRDDQQDVELLDARETGGVTMIKFSRMLTNCDPDDRDITEGTMRVIFAWGDADPASAYDVIYHGTEQRGSKSVNIKNFGLPPNSAQEEIDELNYFDIRMPNVTVKHKRTTYWCIIIPIPQFDTPQHVIRVDPLIRPTNLGVVHHIISYICYGNGIQPEVHGRECWVDNMPDNVTACDTIFYAWAVGQGPFYYPANAGQLLDNEFAFVQLEMHYDNPELRDDIVDDSGFRFYYTDELRPGNVGNLVLGNTAAFPRIVIPPGAPEFRIDTYCSSLCTQTLPPEGIHVVAVLFHTHLLGTKLWTTHIRDGRVIGEIGREDNYDFNYQQSRLLANPIHVLPGDEMITTCIYDSTNRSVVTLGGAGTDNEMCYNFMLYYPRVDLQGCLSGVQQPYSLYQMLMHRAMQGYLDIEPGEFDDSNVYDYLERLSWQPGDAEEIQRLSDTSHGYSQLCNMANSGLGALGNDNFEYQDRLSPEPAYRSDPCDTAINEWPVGVATAVQPWVPLLVISAQMLFFLIG